MRVAALVSGPRAFRHFHPNSSHAARTLPRNLYLIRMFSLRAKCPEHEAPDPTSLSLLPISCQWERKHRPTVGTAPVIDVGRQIVTAVSSRWSTFRAGCESAVPDVRRGTHLIYPDRLAIINR